MTTQPPPHTHQCDLKKPAICREESETPQSTTSSVSYVLTHHTPSDTLVSTRVGSVGDLHAAVVVVDDGEVRFAVGGFAVLGVCALENRDDAFELTDQV